jgi:hypothetical protein
MYSHQFSFLVYFLFVRESTKENFLRSRNAQKRSVLKALPQADVKFRRFDKGWAHREAPKLKS